MMASKCSKCGMELPEALLAQHMEFCDEGESPVSTDANDDMFDDILGGTADEREGGGGVMEPDLDSEFERLVGMLDLSEIGPQLPDVVVTMLDDSQLSSRYNQVREELMQRGEMINPTTQTARDLHSQRAAYIIEMRRRGLME